MWTSSIIGNKYKQVQIYDSIFDLGYLGTKLAPALWLLRVVKGEKNFYKSDIVYGEDLSIFSNSLITVFENI